MSRARDARRKASHREAQAAEEAKRHARRRPALGVVGRVVLTAAAATAAVVVVLVSSASTKTNTDQEVSTLLAGLPQQGTTLGDPDAPVTLRVFADLECPTVKRFVEAKLPGIVNAWVRRGVIKLEYRSLRTDTSDEHIFFGQEIATLAAGNQNTLWDFFVTSMHEQREDETNYATDEFLAEMASQVPGLSQEQWHRDREDTALFGRVAASVRAAHARGMIATPAFLIGRTGGTTYRRLGSETELGPLLDAAALNSYVEALIGRSPAAGKKPGFLGAIPSQD